MQQDTDLLQNLFISYVEEFVQKKAVKMFKVILTGIQQCMKCIWCIPLCGHVPLTGTCTCSLEKLL